MNEDEFEQLASAWLDDRDSPDLRRRIDAALRDDPARADVLADWQRFDDDFRRAVQTPPAIDWPRLHTRIAEAVDRDHTGASKIDNLIATPGDLDRVDWPRVRDRIATAIDAAPARRPRHLWTSVSVAALATAAALLFVLHPDTGPADAPADPVVRVTLSAPTVAPAPAGRAELTVSAPAVAQAQPAQLFNIEPLQPAAPPDEAPDYF
jgi:hypothetical protein